MKMADDMDAEIAAVQADRKKKEGDLVALGGQAEFDKELYGTGGQGFDTSIAVDDGAAEDIVDEREALVAKCAPSNHHPSR